MLKLFPNPKSLNNFAKKLADTNAPAFESCRRDKKPSRRKLLIKFPLARDYLHVVIPEKLNGKFNNDEIDARD